MVPRPYALIMLSLVKIFSNSKDHQVHRIPYIVCGSVLYGIDFLAHQTQRVIQLSVAFPENPFDTRPSFQKLLCAWMM